MFFFQGHLFDCIMALFKVLSKKFAYTSYYYYDYQRLVSGKSRYNDSFHFATSQFLNYKVPVLATPGATGHFNIIYPDMFMLKISLLWRQI